MTPLAPAPTPIEEQVIATLAQCGSMSADDLRRALSVGRQRLSRTLAGLVSNGAVAQGSRITLGADRRRRSVTTYSPVIDGSDGGTYQPDVDIKESEPPQGSAPDAAADCPSQSSPEVAQ